MNKEYIHYSVDVASEICAKLSEGESLRSIVKLPNMPSSSCVFKWLATNQEFRAMYEKAKEESADAHVEDILDIADNQVEQPLLVDGVPLMVDDKMVMVKDMVSVNHAKLRIDARKWLAIKLKPKKYGDKIMQEVTGKDGGAIETADMSEREIGRRIAFELAKAARAVE
jgi:hypothetical protein